MFRLYWLRVGGAARGMPRRDRIHRKRWPALGLITCMALFQSGCQSGPFSNCGMRQRPVQPVRLLRPRLELESSTGATACGLLHPGRRFRRCRGICNARRPSSPRARSATYVSIGVGLDVLHRRSGSVCRARRRRTSNRTIRSRSPRVCRRRGNGASSSLPGNKTSYQTRRQDPNSRLARRPIKLPQTTASTPEPTSRSAQAPSRSPAGEPSGADDQDPLDHLPPLDLPGEVTKSAATPPVPPAADRNDKPVSEAEKKAAVKGESPAPAADDLDLTSGSSPAASLRRRPASGRESTGSLPST